MRDTVHVSNNKHAYDKRRNRSDYQRLRERRSGRTPAQIELAVSKLTEIMFMAEEEFNIKIVPDGDPRLSQDQLPHVQ